MYTKYVNNELRILYVILAFHWVDLSTVDNWTAAANVTDASGHHNPHPNGTCNACGSGVRVHHQSRRRSPPSFSESVYSFEVREDTTPGSVVGMVAAVHGEGRSWEYSVLDDDGDGLFLLNPYSGEFTVTRALDYESEQCYVLTVGLRGAGASRSATVRVYFNVVDVNDNPPVFRPSSYLASVPEDAPMGTCVLTLNVTDADSGMNAELGWSVIAGDEDERFVVSRSGVVCLQKTLDRETVSSYILTVQVSDCAQPTALRLTSTARITIHVEDVNDQAPSFVSASMIAVPEDTRPRTVVMVVEAVDQDAGSGGHVIYELENWFGSRLSINRTSGSVYLDEPLDREVADVFMVRLTARDNGSPQLSTSMNLTVLIKDVNDNDPAFSRNLYSTTVSEDTPRASSLLQVQAHDPDAGLNGRVRYQLPEGSLFLLDPVSGVVSLMSRLDRERSPSHTLTVTAVDLGDPQRSATAFIQVTVTDANDCTPLISPPLVTLHLAENADQLPQVIHQVSAIDEDLDINSELMFSIDKGNEDNMFHLSPNGTFEVLQSLDREERSQYTLHIIAVDTGMPPLTGTGTIMIVVDDINDNPPVFYQDLFHVAVMEDAPAGSTVARIQASDLDDGLNGEIKYILADGNVPFSIDNSGLLITTDALDRETVSSYRLTVVGSNLDHTHPLNSSAVVSVCVEDINDHWPRFLNAPYVANIPATLEPGSVVHAVTAVDADAGLNAKLTFSLFGRYANRFSIDPATGTVFLSQSLKDEGDMIIDVRVKDGGDDPKVDITTVTVRFQNASEFPRVTVEVFKNWLLEDEPVETVIAVVMAESSRKGPVSYYLASGNFEEVFLLDQEKGELTIGSSLDYETNKEFQLCIEVRDSGFPPFSTYDTVSLNIVDMNDNPPLFSKNVYMCEVFENLPAIPVCTVLATDADSGLYGQVEYSILKGNVNKAFTIDVDTGIIRTSKSLDREKLSYYNLTVQGTDKENNLYTCTAIVHITVLDKNDHAPRFTQVFFTDIPEDVAVGSIVIQITSTDDDIGENALISYTIVKHQSLGDSLPFDIDESSGSIVVLRPLDREAQSRYVIKVNANDSAWSISTDVTVQVSDVNDNPPVFLWSQYFATITETKSQEVFVTQVQATDLDFGQNGSVLYYIEPPNEIFVINATTGVITTKQPVSLYDLESPSLSFMVVASDCADVPYYTNTTVTVTVAPYNNFAPAFLPVRPLMYVPYNLDVGTPVIQLTAVDQDYVSGANPVEYIVSGGNASFFFEVDLYSGQVTLKRYLGHHLNMVLTLVVMAKDRGIPPLSSEASVSFVIIQENLFAPHFLELNVTFLVSEDLPVGLDIGRVRAEDKDFGINGLLYYAFQSGNDDGLFSIGKTSGLITLIKELDYELTEFHLLCVIVKDGGWIPKTGELNVTVIIKDVNDNPPVFPVAEYIALLPENSPIGTTVIQVKASDRDSGTNGEIMYSLFIGDNNFFHVDSKDGTVTTHDVFDFEVEKLFVLSVKASNPGNLGYFTVAHVSIHITGQNEFIPKFKKSQYNFTVSESMLIGTRIGKVSATDYDAGPDGEVFYLLIGQSKRAKFNIDKHTGEISVAGDLRRQGHGPVSLRILAKNRGSVNGTDIDETLVWINMVDANDPPKFNSERYITEINEDVSVGTPVIQVKAEDQDSLVEWRHFFYRMESGNINGSFTIEPISGLITVNTLLDRERWPLYNLTVIAIDNATPPATGSTKVVVVVQDINDNPPSLTSTEASVLENQPYGTLVMVLNAYDPDLSPNQGPFMYRLAKSALGSGFSLTLDGILSTTRPMDREENPKHLVPVVLQDAGEPPLSSTATVQIKVLDENDNPSTPRNIYIEVKYYGSSFHGGIIGTVQPNDPDESDMFSCSIRNGPSNMFSFPFHNCDLWSSSYQGEATYNITVEASDRVHSSVNSSVYMNFKGFTNASMDNCVLFYVALPSFEEFLSLQYLKFVKALDSVFNLQASKTHVFGVKVLDEAILLLAAIKTYNGQYLSGEVASSISIAQKKVLEVQSGVKISHITNNPCSARPCQNGATCFKNIYISQDFGVLESPAVIFVAPRQVEIFNCTCLTGFAGTRCEMDIDECDDGPCGNEAVCVNFPGGYSCQCKAGFTGKHCSFDIDECQNIHCQNGGTCVNAAGSFFCDCRFGYEGEFCEHLVDHCVSSPCFQGTCINGLTGYTCNCPFGVSGVNCEEESYGFEELSYMEFGPLDPRNNIILLEVATTRPNSLLLHTSGGVSSAEFLALELVGGRAHFSYDLGDGVVTLRTEKKLADGLFHSIAARRMGKTCSLQVDNCSDDKPSGYCFSHSDGVGTQRTLDVGSSNVTFGGVKSINAILLRPNHVRTHDFVGCVRNAKVNGIPLDSSRALASHNVLASCPRAAASPCPSGACLNGGQCVDLWSQYSCQCGDLFTGADCATEMTEESALRLGRRTYVEYVVKESYRRELQLAHLGEGGGRDAATAPQASWMEVKLRATERDGALLSYWGSEGGATLMVKSGKLVYLSGGSSSGPLMETVLEAPLVDGRWHILRLYWDGLTSVLYVDSLPVMNGTDPAAGVERIILGGGTREHREMGLSGFSGCVEYFRFNGHTLPFAGYSDVVDSRPSSTPIHTGCPAPDGCMGAACWDESPKPPASCSSWACQNGGTCREGGSGNMSCSCLPNYTGAFCELCSPSTHNRSACAEAHGGALLWIAGAVLPASFLLISLVLLVIIIRWRTAKPGNVTPGRSFGFPAWGGQGRDNKAFQRDSGDTSFWDACAGAGEHPDVIRNEPRESRHPDAATQSYIEASLAALDTYSANSELEYYDINSIRSIFQSDIMTYDTYCERPDLERKGQAAALLENSQKGFVANSWQENLVQRPAVDWYSSQQDRGTDKRYGSLAHLSHPDCEPTSSAERAQRSPRRKQVTVLVPPPKGLSVDELARMSGCANRPPSVVDSSSESESHSGFTCSVQEPKGDLPFDGSGQPRPASGLGLREPSCTTICPAAASGGVLNKAAGAGDSPPSAVVLCWDDLLNMGLHFDTYSQVFEDIAALPLDLVHDRQSDEEEII